MDAVAGVSAEAGFCSTFFGRIGVTCGGVGIFDGILGILDGVSGIVEAVEGILVDAAFFDGVGIFEGGKGITDVEGKTPESGFSCMVEEVMESETSP